MKFFNTRLLDEAKKFVFGLDKKTARKVVFNIDMAEQTNDPRLFKKLNNEIWEFRTLYGGIQIRLLAFWDKTDGQSTLVLATHGFIKKVDKVPDKEIQRAANIRKQYFEQKQL